MQTKNRCNMMRIQKNRFMINTNGMKDMRSWNCKETIGEEKENKLWNSRKQ